MGEVSSDSNDCPHTVQGGGVVRMSTRTCSVPLPPSLLEERMIQREPVNRYTGRTAGLKNDQNKKTITQHQITTHLAQEGRIFFLALEGRGDEDWQWCERRGSDDHTHSNGFSDAADRDGSVWS